MKTGGWLLLAAIACFAAHGRPLVGVPLAEALDRLADAGDLRVIYNSELVAPGLIVGADPEGDDARARLFALLEPFGLTIEPGPRDRLLVVRLPEVEATLVPLRGMALDAVSALPVAGVRVAVYPGARVVRTGKDGRFEIPVAPTRLTVFGSGPAHIEQHVDVETAAIDETLELRLQPLVSSLNPITVTASHYSLRYDDPTRSQYLTRQQVDRLPHLADDVFRAVRLLPGVASGDFSAANHVRGGAANELSVELDGLTLHQPYHLKDLLTIFSVIDSNAIDGVEFYSGVFPAQFGDANSAVLAVDSITPGENRGRLGVSFINAFAQGNGTLGDNGWWLASARTGYLDVVLSYIDSTSGLDPSYVDILGKVGWDLGYDTQFEISTLIAVDDSVFREEDLFEFTLDEVDGEFLDAYLWANLDHRWTDVLTSRTMLFVGTLDRESIGIINEPLTVGFEFDDRTFDFYGVEQSFTWEAPSWRVTGGVELQHQTVDYEYRSAYEPGPVAVEPTPPQNIEVLASPSGNVYGAYATAQFDLSDAWRAELGARYDRQEYLEPSDDQVSPRANLLWRVAERTRIRAGWGQLHQAQGIEELQVEVGLDTFFPAQRVEQAVLSLEHRWENGLEFRTEAYDKDYSDPIPYVDRLFDDHEVLGDLSSDRVFVEPDAARARGIEVSLRDFQRENFRWWASYTYSEAEERIGDAWVPRNWDQPHAVNVGVSLDAAAWTFTFAWQYHTGWPVTAVQRTPGEPPTVGERNVDRLGGYHRLDVRASRTIPLPNSTLQLYVEVLNLYNRKNECCREVFQFRSNQQQRSFEVSEQWLPFTPSLGIKWEF
ncbi:MAG: TonB-dependent receptor [Pseudomonadota bacterium]